MCALAMFRSEVPIFSPLKCLFFGGEGSYFLVLEVPIFLHSVSSIWHDREFCFHCLYFLSQVLVLFQFIRSECIFFQFGIPIFSDGLHACFGACCPTPHRWQVRPCR